MRRVDYTGRRFGKLVAVKRIGTNKRGQSVWLFDCDCGKQVEALSGNATSGNTTSCGCSGSRAAYNNLTGQKFGRLTAIKITGKYRKGFKWECACDCGESHVVTTDALVTGSIASCGCSRSEDRSRFYKYGKSKSKKYQRDAHLRKNFNISLERYQQLFDDQCGRCAICGNEETSKKSLSVDHCHKTGRIRALLCGKCNSGIGMLGDDPVIIRAALEYVESFEREFDA